MSLQPLGNRVLICPDGPPESDGLIVMPEIADRVPVSGTVAALGPGGSRQRFKARQRAIAAAADLIEEGDGYLARRIREELLNTPDPHRDIAVGDRVVFPAEVGFKVAYDGTEYLLVDEDDVAIVEREDV